jgi:hypothetical protein
VSDPIDIKALDEYLKGGSDISRRYREIGSEDVVPPELDRRVLDEARAAVASGKGGRSRPWLRWSAPLTLAASVVLVVTVVIESGVQNDASFATEQVAADKARVVQQRQLEESKLQEQVAQQPLPEPRLQFAPEPAPDAIAPQAPSAPAPAAAPPAVFANKAEAEHLNSVAPEEVRVNAKALRSDASEVVSPVTVVTEPVDSPAPQIAAEQPAPSLAGSVATVSARKEAATAEADSADDLSSVSVTGTRTRRAGRTAGPRQTISGSALSSETRPAADEDAAGADQRSDPQKWLESIRELRRAGKVEEADRAWQEFHKAFPNFPVADDDLARKQR